MNVHCFPFSFHDAVPAGILAALGAAFIRPYNLKKIGGMAALGGGAA